MLDAEAVPRATEPRLRTLGAAAISGKTVAAVLTLLVVGTGRGVEGNPVVAALIDGLGLFPATLATVGAASLLALAYRRAADRYPRAALATFGLFAALLWADALYNAVVVATVGLPAELPAAVVVAALTVTWAGVGVFVRPDILGALLAASAAVPAPELQTVGVMLLVVAVVLSAALAGVPASVFGPGAPAQTVDRAAVAGTMALGAIYYAADQLENQ